jgi:hypothetical protein
MLRELYPEQFEEEEEENEEIPHIEPIIPPKFRPFVFTDILSADDEPDYKPIHTEEIEENDEDGDIDEYIESQLRKPNVEDENDEDIESIFGSMMEKMHDDFEKNNAKIPVQPELEKNDSIRTLEEIKAETSFYDEDKERDEFIERNKDVDDRDRKSVV